VFKRFGPPVLVTLLMLATGVAFAVTELLKLEPSPITRTRVTPLFSPTCHCDTSKARVAFSLRRNERVTLLIIGPRGGKIRRLLDGEDKPSGPLHTIWNGRNNTGRLVPDGEYRVHVYLGERRKIELPNIIRLDTQAPKITSSSVSSHTISPDGDGNKDLLHINDRVSEGAQILLYVDGKLVEKTRYRAGKSNKFDWNGTIDGRLSMGWHNLTLKAVDLTGNKSATATMPIPVQVRILKLRPERIRVVAGNTFQLAISTDRESVRWRFNGQIGLAPSSRTLVLSAPPTPGRYRVIVRSGPYRAGALIIVR
jgi:flagellar hook assembly protein FlgD